MKARATSASTMLSVTLLSPVWRFVTAALVLVALATIPTYLLALFLLPPVPPIVMIRSFVVGTALPAATAWAIGRAFRGVATVRDGRLRLDRGDVGWEVACEGVAAVRAWRLPLPAAGVALRLRANGRAPFGIVAQEPFALLDALAGCGVDVAAARRSPSLLAAGTRRRTAAGAVIKFAGLGILPAALLFYTHQHIAYGGTFGQWYQEGAAAWWRTFGEYWGTTVVLLVSYAGIWRGVGELVVWSVAATAPARVAGARRLVDAACALAYYGGIPVVLALRYLA